MTMPDLTNPTTTVLGHIVVRLWTITIIGVSAWLSALSMVILPFLEHAKSRG